MNRKSFQISGVVLKLLACVSMVIDHAAYVFIRQSNSDFYSKLYIVCRCIGRIAFPIFLFLLIEGYYHTSSKLKYGMQLFVFGLISEIPYDLAFYNTTVYFRHNNVMFTLLCCLLMLIGYSKIMENAKQLDSLYARRLLNLCGGMFVALMAIIAYILGVDYRCYGVMACFVMYIFYETSPILGYVFGVVILTFLNGYELCALVAVPLVYAYNGKSGYKSKWLKCFFYSFYPLHIILLALIAKIFNV